MIYSLGSYYVGLTKEINPRTARSFSSQILAYASAARTKVMMSKEPLSVYHEFSKKCNEQAGKIGLELIAIP